LQNADWAYLGKKEIGKRISEKNKRPNLHFAELHFDLPFPLLAPIISPGFADARLCETEKKAR
jgi:hypothetical protein